MRKVMFILACASIMAGCQKEVVQSSSVLETSTLSSDALAPLSAHVASFNYPSSDLKKYSFIKTFYPDNRVASLKLNSPLPVKAYWGSGVSNYYDEKITYSPNKALMHGVRTYHSGFGYITYPNDLEFNFNAFNLCTSVYEIDAKTKVKEWRVKLYYNTTNPNFVFLTKISFNSGKFTDDFLVQTSKEGNIRSILNANQQGVRYGYNLQSNTNKVYFYEPAHDYVNYLYDLLETMQWVPQPKNERTTITTMLSDEVYDRTIETYFNHQYDANGYLNQYQLATSTGLPAYRITWKY